MTPDEIKELCITLLPMGQKESQELLAGYGLNRKSADMLRHLLGTTGKRPERIAQEVKDKIRKAVEGEGGLSAYEAARRFGIGHQTIFNWIYREHWNYLSRHDFWTERKIMRFCVEINKGTKVADIAMIFGTNLSTTKNMKNKIQHLYHMSKWKDIILKTLNPKFLKEPKK